jgi:hypothetical protein
MLELRAQNNELTQQLAQFKSMVQTLEENVTDFTSRESKAAQYNLSQLNSTNSN